MNPRTLALLAIVATGLSACIIIDADESDRGNFHVVSQFGLPNLQSVSIGQDSLAVEIPGGCATKQNVVADVDKEGRSAFEIRIDYADPDICDEDSPGQARLLWTYEELGIPLDSTVRVVNRIAR